MTKRAFTLIELLVVIAIIAILTSGGIVMYSTAKDKANDSTRLTTLHELELAVEQFKDDTGALPINSDFSCLVSQGYIKRVPFDIEDKGRTDATLNANGTDYRYKTTGGKFELSAQFAAKTNDPKEDNDGGTDGNRYEIGTDPKNIDASVGANVIYLGGACPLP